MRAASSGIAKPTNSKANFRDKRYVVPSLLVDLSTEAYATTLWSASQLILRDVHDDLAVDEEFTGILAFDDASDSGLFQARVARLDPARRLIGAAFQWFDPAAQALLAARLGARERDGADTVQTMKVSIAHKTLNWSLSGLLVGRYQGNLAQGQTFAGTIRLEKSQEPGRFAATVIRADIERRSLALKFQDLSTSTFALLEAAMKKTSAE